MLGFEQISDTNCKPNFVYVTVSDGNLIPLYVLTQQYWTIVLDLGDWGRRRNSCCRFAARVLPGVSHASLCTYQLVDWLVCKVIKRCMMNTQHWSRVGKFMVITELM